MNPMTIMGSLSLVSIGNIIGGRIIVSIINNKEVKENEQTI
jgi:formate/nitrite transporter FocA (FNT family)